LSSAAPAASACRVRGLATPISAYTTVPTGARSAGAPLGFSLQGVLLVAAGTPFGGLALLALPRSIAPGGTTARGRLQGINLATSSFGRRAPKNPTVDAFLGFTPPEPSPHPFGHALWSRCRPSHPFGGATSRPARVSGLREADGSAWSVSGLPALLGSLTFRPSRRSVRRAGGRAHFFTSREMPGVYGTARS
jgi:hypothetical protein